MKRITATEEDRDFLKMHGLLPSQLKTRGISLVVARNIFRVFGHKSIRRGRPVRDDYFVGDQEEPAFYDEPLEGDDDMEYGVYDFAKNLGSQEGGPYRRSGPAILGFRQPMEQVEPFVPTNIPPELEADAWMLKCATSAADFNRRLVRNRPISFLDLHTNVEQVPRATQPSRVMVQIAPKEKLSFAHVQKDVVVEDGNDTSGIWSTVAVCDKTSKYPLALMHNQYQDYASM